MGHGASKVTCSSQSHDAALVYYDLDRLGVLNTSLIYDSSKLRWDESEVTWRDKKTCFH